MARDRDKRFRQLSKRAVRQLAEMALFAVLVGASSTLIDFRGAEAQGGSVRNFVKWCGLTAAG